MSVKLKELQISDSKTISGLADNKNIWINLTDSFPNPYNESDARDFIKLVKSSEPCGTFKIVYNLQTCGVISVEPKYGNFKHTAILGYWVGEKFWNKGIASEAVNQIIKYTKNTFPDIIKIIAEVFDYNPASMKVLEKCGFTKEAVLKKAFMKNNKLIDIHYYTLFIK